MPEKRQTVAVASWEQYERRFRAAVTSSPSRRGFDEAYTLRCLEYARPLFDRGLPIVYDQRHLARLVGYDLAYLLGVSNAPTNFYRSYSIPKVSGGTRTITEPLPSLKEIQRWILQFVLQPVPVHPFAKGFAPGRSIRDNARFHVGQRQVLTVDIKDFFGNVHKSSVIKIFSSLGYTPRVAVLLAGLCTLNGALPQGAPTSPALSNLAAARIDNRLAAFARRSRIRYTRYADDLTFSGTFDAGDLIGFVRSVLEDNGFRLNESKTRLMQRHERQETTGIVVNEKLQVPRELRRQIRQETFYIEKFGLDSHLHRSRHTRANYLRHLLGLVGFALFINRSDRDATHALKVLVPLLHSNE